MSEVKADSINLLGLVEALTILAKYEPNGSYCCEHDQMWAAEEEKTKNMTNEERDRLKELGWFISSEGSWSVFA